MARTSAPIPNAAGPRAVHLRKYGKKSDPDRPGSTWPGRAPAATERIKDSRIKWVRWCPMMAVDSIRFSHDLYSDKTDDKPPQDAKRPEPKTSTNRGIVINLNEENENASDSIYFNRESLSNEIDGSHLQYQKDDNQTRMTTFQLTHES
jgi:hypothetical protein